jgi:hypothetical protein
MKFTRMFKRTSLIIFVTFLVVFNTVLNSFFSCCEAREEPFFDNDEHACCICCNNTEDQTFFTNHSSGKTQAKTDDYDSCVCFPNVSRSDNYFVFIKYTSLPFHFSPSVLTTAFAEKNLPIRNYIFFPTIVDQKNEYLSTVVLLI